MIAAAKWVPHRRFIFRPLVVIGMGQKHGDILEGFEVRQPIPPKKLLLLSGLLYGRFFAV
jgi:hypothetical protein